MHRPRDSVPEVDHTHDSDRACVITAGSAHGSQLVRNTATQHVSREGENHDPPILAQS